VNVEDPFFGRVKPQFYNPEVSEILPTVSIPLSRKPGIYPLSQDRFQSFLGYLTQPVKVARLPETLMNSLQI